MQVYAYDLEHTLWEKYQIYKNVQMPPWLSLGNKECAPRKEHLVITLSVTTFKIMFLQSYQSWWVYLAIFPMLWQTILG